MSSSGTSAPASSGAIMRVGTPQRFCSSTLRSMSARSRSCLAEEQIAALAEPDVDADLLREARAQLDRLLHEAHVLLGRPLHAHAAAVAPRGALRQVAALEHDDVGDAALGQLVGDAEPHDAAADDGDVALRLRRRLASAGCRRRSRASRVSSVVGARAKIPSGAGCTGGRDVNGCTATRRRRWPARTSARSGPCTPCLRTGRCRGRCSA